MEIPKFIMTVVKRLHASDHQAYIVGGAVRDHCLHRKVTDWDVATSARPEEIKSIFRDIKCFSLRHDTVTLVHSARHYEVTTFKGSKNFGHSVEEDLAHRDFTINAMAYDKAKGAILDPYGGREDILCRLVRAVGDPKERFREDPVRLLRAVRLATELGFKIELKTLKTISLMAEKLDSVARERKREELLKILVSRKPSIGFNLMVKTGLLKHLLPELLEGYRKKQDASHRFTIYKHIMKTIDQVEPDPVLRLTALLHDIAKPRVREKIEGEFRFLGHEKASARLAKEIMLRFKFSNEMIGKVTSLVAHHMSTAGYHAGWSDGAVRRLIRRVGSENIDHLLSFRRADILAHGLNDEKMDIFSELKKRVEVLRKRSLAVKIGDLAVDGHRVMEILDLSRGPEVGKVLNGLLEKVADDPGLNTEEELIALLKEMKN
jgi:tRNA nucleotidyltransferase (CCA-adding enzyme)